MIDKYYQLADYMLNHYDKTSHNDKFVLAKKLKDIYNSGLDTLNMGNNAEWENDGFGHLLLVEKNNDEENVVCIISEEFGSIPLRLRVDRMTRSLSKQELEKLINMW